MKKPMYICIRGKAVKNEQTGETEIINIPVVSDSPEELFSLVDNQNHEFLIREVKSNNAKYMFAKISLILPTVVLGIIGLCLANTINNFINGKGNQDGIAEFLFRAIKYIFIGIDLWIIIGMVKEIAKNILYMLSKKEIVNAGNQYVKKHYPSEYSTIGDPKSFRRKNK